MKEWKQNFLAKQDSVLVVTVILNHNSLSVGCDLKQSQIFSPLAGTDKIIRAAHLFHDNNTEN